MELKDISDVCKMLGTTSRALRFYEQKGIISSTKDGLSQRRCYSPEQIDLIRNVLTLRRLGISVSKIAELQKENIDLRSAICDQMDRIYSIIYQKQKELNQLYEALAVLGSGRSIYQQDIANEPAADGTDLITKAKRYAKAFVSGDSDDIICGFSPALTEHMPAKKYESVREEVLRPLGKFLGFGETYQDGNFENIVYQKLVFERLSLRMKLVFHGGMIDGFWLEYIL